jgi:hypothetical protein
VARICRIEVVEFSPSRPVSDRGRRATSSHGRASDRTPLVAAPPAIAVRLDGRSARSHARSHRGPDDSSRSIVSVGCQIDASTATGYSDATSQVGVTDSVDPSTAAEHSEAPDRSTRAARCALRSLAPLGRSSACVAVLRRAVGPLRSPPRRVERVACRRRWNVWPVVVGGACGRSSSMVAWPVVVGGACGRSSSGVRVAGRHCRPVGRRSPSPTSRAVRLAPWLVGAGRSVHDPSGDASVARRRGRSASSVEKMVAIGSPPARGGGRVDGVGDAGREPLTARRAVPARRRCRRRHCRRS